MERVVITLSCFVSAATPRASLYPIDIDRKLLPAERLSNYAPMLRSSQDRRMIILLIGVTGSGKTTVGKLLARQLDWRFYEGDDFHSPTNIEKMRSGVPLNDKDRLPWLQTIQEAIRSALERGENAVFAVSALKNDYRRVLQIDAGVRVVHLKAKIELIRERLQRRTGHFMNPVLIQSQFDTLEEPDGVLQINAELPADEIVRIIRARVSL